MSAGKTDHPLPEAWVLRAHWTSNAVTYAASYTTLFKTQTCEDWGGLVRYGIAPSDLASTVTVPLVARRAVHALSYFRDGINPEWEDPANESGVTYCVRGVFTAPFLHDLWRDLTCECARGASGESLNGVLFSRKRHRTGISFKVEFWCRDASAQPWISQFLAPRDLVAAAAERLSS